MGRVVNIEIDGTKLAEIFKKRGLKMQDVSRDCGFDGSYFSHKIRENRMTKSAMILLQDRYKIYPGDYELTKPEPEIVSAELLPVECIRSTEVEFTISEDTVKKLHQIIYSAVYEAVKMALNE